MELCRLLPRVTARKPLLKTVAHYSARTRVGEESHDLFDYSSGRWMCVETTIHAFRLQSRRRCFDISELKRLAVPSIQQRTEDVAKFEKLAEGGFNRAFLITMHDGSQLVARIPYLVTAPGDLLVASEVAAMDFLRSHGIPVPKVYGYSTASTNPAGMEYIFMELMRGRNLGGVWFDSSERQRITFPASGSLYYRDDIQSEEAGIVVPTTDHLSDDSRFCIRPDTTLRLWFGKRFTLPVDRGPYKDCLAALNAGEKKEISYLTKYGHPIQPFQRLRREIYDYKPRSHLDHLMNLRQYLQIAPRLIPHHDPTLARPVMRHPDLQPKAIFVSDKFEITGLIGWSTLLSHTFMFPYHEEALGLPCRSRFAAKMLGF
ncbi:protein kinase subdomain-containing protein [Nannizzia gypsea CBS 118893]|uniref:Protein kinase subdomain-containing protein n=1 Tax=Arthroderma gypseum (strain ATCC MYA-4604 / CBS 118893) TaxID=535722 RepID=E4US27_ARTGP|nr:protein kinase subdomain-containing protein [Nannizzia gypsea CBS 118893]EFR00445.1 protein kinase subdomain-containing protein [Nannizzia gypsea CBS 118893]